MGERCISVRAVGFFFRSRIVNCRIGSLEICQCGIKVINHVNCRIGSLENDSYRAFIMINVNCRIGSLEIWTGTMFPFPSVNCRIGSLEMSKNERVWWGSR